MRLKIIAYLFTSLFLASCNFNKLFLQPTKVPENKRKLTITTDIDTTIIRFDSTTYQPTFIKNGIDTLDFDFTIESVVFQSANGNKLNGWMLKPKNSVPSVTLLHFHGNAGFLLNQYRSMTPLLEYGFQIFVFDYSGFGFSEGKATRNNVLIDGNSALSYVKSRDDVKDTKLFIYGHSLGGHLSAVVASERQAEIDGLVIEGAFSSHKDIAAQKASFIGRIFVSEKYSATKAIRNFHKPVLIIHSKEDPVIPFKMGQKLFDNANAPKEFYEIQKCHICGPSFYAESISLKILKMLGEN